MNVEEFEAGPEQLFVLYRPADTGQEVDPGEVYAEIAEDAARRAAEGYWIVSTSTMEARHAATAFGREGSGYTTKVSVTVVYAHVRASSEEGSSPQESPLAPRA